MEEVKILGFKLNHNLSWKSNTKQMITKAFKKLWILKRLKNQGAGIEDLTDIFVKQVRSILEYGAPVWNSSLIKQEVLEIERVQKVFLHMVLGREYESYEIALQKTDLENLADRRETLCRNFAIKTQKTLNTPIGLSKIKRR